MVVQWLRLHASNAVIIVSTPSWGTRVRSLIELLSCGMQTLSWVMWDLKRRNPKVATGVLAHKIACVTNRRLENQDSLQVSGATDRVTNQRS